MTNFVRVTFLVSARTAKCRPGKKKRPDPPCGESGLPVSLWSRADREVRRSYWIAWPPEGDAVSLPPEPIELVDCQIVPVVFVKKKRVPVDDETGSAQA